MSERPVSVHKLGGTSLGDAERIVRAARLIAAASRRRRVVAVASAMGGATDLLLRAAHEAERGRLRPALRSVAELKARHEAAAAGIAAATGAAVPFDLAPFGELETALSGIALLRERTPRVTDLVASFGERLSVPLLAAALEATGVPARAVDARTFLVTDAGHGAATCDRRKTDPRARRRASPRRPWKAPPGSRPGPPAGSPARSRRPTPRSPTAAWASPPRRSAPSPAGCSTS